MEEKDISLNDVCRLLLMHALCRAGYLEEVLNILYIKINEYFFSFSTSVIF